jgi:hypothetical protein
MVFHLLSTAFLCFGGRCFVGGKKNALGRNQILSLRSSLGLSKTKNKESMKVKMLNSGQLKKLLPAIMKAWHEQEFPTILAGVVKASRKKGKPPEWAFSIAANSATHWLNHYLSANHSSCPSVGEDQAVLKALLNAVKEKLG